MITGSDLLKHRDPRTDPAKGDALLLGDDTQCTVTSAEPGLGVSYDSLCRGRWRRGLWMTLAKWRERMGAPDAVVARVGSEIDLKV